MKRSIHHSGANKARDTGSARTLYPAKLNAYLLDIRQPKQIGLRLKRIRYAHDYGEGRQKEFAQLLGITSSTWNAYETGKYKGGIPLEKAQRLVDAFAGLSLDYIFDGKLDHVTVPIRERLTLVPF
jgi:DNA-binding XRE family transcriptional regulator